MPRRDGRRPRRRLWGARAMGGLVWPGNRKGVAASEFALMVPIFVLILFATADLIRVFRAQLRTETVAVQVGQIISQCRIITDGATVAAPGNPDNSDISQIFAHGARIAGNIINVNGTSGGAMIITAVGRNNNLNRAEWRRRVGNASFTSTVSTGVPPVAATITNGFIVPAGQAMFVTEVYAIVQPWALSAGLIGTALPKVVGGTTLFLSRAPDPTALLTVPRVATTPECTA